MTSKKLIFKYQNFTYHLFFRSTHQRYSVRKGVLRNFIKIHRKTPVPESFLHNVKSPLLKKRLWHKCFPVILWNFYEYLFHRKPLVAGSSLFFNYLAAAWPILGHFRGDNLIHPMSITEFFIFGPKVTGSLVNEVGSVSLVERLVEFEPGAFRL